MSETESGVSGDRVPESIELVLGLSEDVGGKVVIDDEEDVKAIDDAVDTYFPTNVGTVVGMDVEEVNVNW